MTRLFVAVLRAPRLFVSLAALAALAPLSIFAAAPETEWRTSRTTSDPPGTT